MLTEEQVLEALEDVKDPEIPMVSIVELGMIAGVTVESDHVEVRITPTFAGCPAVRVMQAAVEERVRALGVPNVSAKITFEPPWNSSRISPEGRRKLKEFGLAPARPNTSVDLVQIADIACPFCGSTNTSLESPFGTTLCRSIHYCNSCKQSFEQFKPV